MTLSKYFIRQTATLLIGIIFILACLFQINGVSLPSTQFEVDVTYTGKGKFQGQELELNCDNVKNQSIHKECQIFSYTLAFAIVSMTFGGLSILLIILREQDSLKTAFKKLKVLKLLVILCIFIPLVIEITMPIWKIIYNDPDLTYKIGPVIQEFLSFTAFLIALVFEGLQYKNQTKISLLP